VEYDGVGLVEGIRTRTVSGDEVIALVNEFLHARFFDALDKYWGDTSVARDGDKVNFAFSGMHARLRRQQLSGLVLPD
jgi:hypothetical protein